MSTETAKEKLTFELKKVKHSEANSQETACFKAELWVNGKHIADVSNQGIGGSNDFYPMEGVSWSELEKFDNLDTECEILERVELWAVVTKNQSKGLVVKKGDKLSIITWNAGSLARVKNSINGNHLIAQAVAKYEAEGYTVLNRNI
jgi:hypothetical protein